MTKRIALAAAAGILGVASFAHASPADDKQWELTLSGTGANDNDFESASAGVNFQLGYWFNNQNELSLRQSLIYSDSGGPGSSLDGKTAIAYDYYFDTGADQRWVPFVGANIGYRYGDATDDSITAAPEAGVRYYVNTTTFIQAIVSYDFLLKESFGDGAFNYGLGIGFRW